MNREAAFYAAAHAHCDVVPTDRARHIILRSDFTYLALHQEMYKGLDERLAPLINQLDTIWIDLGSGEQFFVVEIPPSYDECWAKIHRLVSRYAVGQRRYARKAKAEGFHLKEHYKVIWNIQDGYCYFSGEVLGKTFESSLYEVDHLEPLSGKGLVGDSGGMSGTDWPTNLALVTRTINRMKGGSSSKEFIRHVLHLNLFNLTESKWRKKVDSKRESAFRDFIDNNECH